MMICVLAPLLVKRLSDWVRCSLASQWGPELSFATKPSTVKTILKRSENEKIHTNEWRNLNFAR